MKKPPIPSTDKFAFSPIERISSARVLIAGKPYIDFTSFDYFNFFQDARVRNCLHQACALSGLTAGSPRSLSGTSQEILDLEVALSRSFFTKTSLFFSSRQQAVFSFVTGALRESDLVIYDEDSTSPVADGCYLIGATTTPIDLGKPNWREELRSIVLSTPAKRIFFYAEALSSATGRMLDINDTLSQLNQFGASAIIDVGYSLGLIPPYSIPGATYIGGFGFGLPGVGGFICGGDLVEGIRGFSKILQTEAALPPFLANLNRQFLNYLPELYLKFPQLIESVISYLNDFKKLGLTLLAPDDLPSPILSIRFDNSYIAKAVYDKLISSGIFVSRAAQGSIRSEKSILRLVITTAHSENDRISIVRVLSEHLIK